MRTAEEKAAHAAYMREYNARNREKKREQDRQGYIRRRDVRLAYQAEYYAANKAKVAARGKRYRAEIQEIAREAKSQPCQRCGGSFPIAAMEFHHRDPSTKLGEVCNMSTPNLARKELAKCDVLCAICHRLVEDKNGRGRPTEV